MIIKYSLGIREAIPKLLELFDGDERVNLENAIDRSNDKACFYSILCFAIECRGDGAITQSLLLLNWLNDLGIRHPLILDNKIRALVDDHRFLEALALLPSLSGFAEVEIYTGAVKCLLPHQLALLQVLRSHCLLSQDHILNNIKFPDPSSEHFLIEVLKLACTFQEIGDCSRALTLLQELMQWGVWSLEALQKDAQVIWAVLVIRLGTDVLSDLSLYHKALKFLEIKKDTDAVWELVKVNYRIQTDCSQSDRALLSVVEFTATHPSHNVARSWLIDQQTIPERSSMRKSDADKVREIDQAIVYDSLLLDYFLNLKI